MMEISTFKTPSYEIRLEINRLEGKLAKAKYHRLSSILYLTLKFELSFLRILMTVYQSSKPVP